MEKSKHQTMSRILRVGKELLVLLEITILTNKQDRDNCTSWFTDSELRDVLLMLRDPICGRMDELMKEEINTKRKMTKTGGEVTGRSDAHCLLVGKKVKVGLQFKRHSVSKICLIPSQRSEEATMFGSACHSGGGFEKMIMFPEKVQVVVCDNDPLSKEEETVSCLGMGSTHSRALPTSRYFKNTDPQDGPTRAQITNTAKKKRLTLKRIVSTRTSSTSGGGGFADHSVPQNLRGNLVQNLRERDELKENRSTIEKETERRDKVEDNLNGETEMIYTETRISFDSSEYSDDEDDDDDERGEASDINVTCGTNQTVMTREYMIEEDQNKLMSDVESRKTVADPKKGHQDVLTDGSCSDRDGIDGHADQTSGCRSHTDQTDGHRSHTDQTDGHRSHTDQTNGHRSPTDQKDGHCSHTDQTNGHRSHVDQINGHRSHTDQINGHSSHTDQTDGHLSHTDQTDGHSSRKDYADQYNASKGQSLYEYSQEDRSESDIICQDIFSENKCFDGAVSCPGNTKEDVLSLNKNGISGEGFNRVKKRLYSDTMGDDLISGYSGQTSPISSPCKEVRNIDDKYGSDDNSNHFAEGELPVGWRDSDMDVQQLNKRKKRNKLKRRRCEMIRLSSSDEDSCQFDISHLLQKKDFNKNNLNSEPNLEHTTEEELQPKYSLSDKSNRTEDGKISKTFHSQKPDKDSSINLISSERTGTATQLQVSDDRRVASIHSDRVSDRITTPYNKDDEPQSEDDEPQSEDDEPQSEDDEPQSEDDEPQSGDDESQSEDEEPQSEDDSFLLKEPLLETVEEANDENGSYNMNVQHSNKNLVSNDRWDVEGSENESQRKLVHKSKQSESDAEDHSLLMSDHSVGSLQVDSDDSLPEVSYAKEMEERTADVTMATSFNGKEFTDEGKELSNSSDNLLMGENLQKVPFGGQECSASESDFVCEATDQSRVKVTKVTEDLDACTRDVPRFESNSQLLAKSFDRTSKSQTFFHTSNYENLESENESFVLKRQNVGFSKNRNRIKPKPLQATNLQNNKSFGSMKRFDDTVFKKRCKVGGRRDSQIEVTPKNCENWWTTGVKKERRSEVIDLVAMDDEMVESLKSVKKIADLSESQLQYLTKDNESYLREIFQGKRACVRHTKYKRSSSFRAGMTYLVSYGEFSPDNLEAIMDTLVPIFCKHGSKFLDYVSKVLLPELLVKICMDVLHLDYQQAESLF